MDEDTPPLSPLSDLSSQNFDSSPPPSHHQASPSPPPAKRQKLDEHLDEAYEAAAAKLDIDTMSISSDSSAEVPYSPSHKLEDDDTHEQITRCAWAECPAGDLGNMDRLVEHIHGKHIETREKKYWCMWKDCKFEKPHASAYALKAHMRSHTREKPFYCTLPECDRTFTRSDALAKHHRTVHETEALRPSDPIPKSMSAAHKTQRLKASAKEDQLPPDESRATNGTTNGHAALDPPGWTTSYPDELGFTAEEEAQGSKALFQLLRRQIVWAEEEGEELKKQVESLEEVRKSEWLDKEILLEQALETERDWNERRQMVLAGNVELPTSDAIRAAALKAGSSPLLGPSPSPIPMDDSRQAAEVLASMGQN